MILNHKFKRRGQKERLRRMILRSLLYAENKDQWPASKEMEDMIFLTVSRMDESAG